MTDQETEEAKPTSFLERADVKLKTALSVFARSIAGLTAVVLISVILWQIFRPSHFAIQEVEIPPGLREHGVTEALVAREIARRPDEIRKALEWYDRASPALGARIVARAWTEPDFKQDTYVQAQPV